MGEGGFALRLRGPWRDRIVGLAGSLLAGTLARTLARRRPWRGPKRLVVIKPCCLGDVLGATAVVAQLRRAYPEAHLAFAVGPWARAAVEHNPKIDELVDCGPVGAGRYTIADYLTLARRLRAGRYDAAYVLERSPLLTLLPFLAGIPQRAGIDSEGRGFSLTHRAKLPFPLRHEVELYLDVLRATGLEPVSPRLEFFPTPADEDWAAARLPASGRWVAIHPGGATNPGMTLSAKRWLPERFATVAERLLAEGYGAVLVGAPSDREAVDAVRQHLGPSAQHPRLLDLGGQASLGQLGALLRRCALFLGNDTGPMHLAAAVGTPTVAIFGPSTPLMYGPYGERTVAVYRPVECSPCFLRGRFNQACQDWRCIRAVEVDDVWQALSQLIPTGVGEGAS